MTFQEFLVNPYDQNLGWIVLASILAAYAITGGIMLSVSAKRFRLALPIGTIILFVGAMAAAAYLSELSSAIDNKNETIAENNLKEKYDIVGVLWGESYADFDESDSVAAIVIQDKDSNILKFRYKIDKETREPYLLNEPDSNSVKSNDLLLDKAK